MNKKIKECFTTHTIMHSLFALGLGFLLVSWFPSLANIWLGVVLMAIAVVYDVMRK